jgi:hypothetical protein
MCLSSLVAIHSIGADPGVVMARAVAKVVARLTAADPLNRAHAAWCAVPATPTHELTEETCDCGGGEQS